MQICIDCYLDPAQSISFNRALTSAADAKSALEFFDLPVELWPPGIRMASRTLEMHARHANKLRGLTREAAQVGHVRTPVACLR